MPSEIGILPIRIGEGTGVALAKDFSDFYERIASLIVGDPVCNVCNRDHLRTIGLPPSLIRNEEAIYDIAASALRGVPTTANCLIVDLANPPREEFAVDSIVRGVVTAMSEIWWAKDSKPAVILVNQPVSTSAFAYIVMTPHISTGRLALIDRRGVVQGAVPAGSLDHRKYVASLRAVQDDPLELLQRKMIRRVGHFRHRDRGKGRATKFYFDGCRCERETEFLLSSFLAQRKSKQLLFHAPISQWLADVVQAVSINQRVKMFDLGPWINNRRAADLIKQVSIHSNPLVVVPMVDTGRTLERIHEFIRRNNPKSLPSYLSVVCTATDDATRRIRKVETKLGAVEVSYLLHVSQTSYDLTNEPDCWRGRAGSSFDMTTESNRLTTHAFWSMVAEAGFKEEEDVPNTRKSLGFVPRLPEILEANGPLLAYKIEKLLWPIPLDAVLISADENGARALTNCIRSLVGSTVIRIPRPVIDNISLTLEPSAILTEFRRAFSEREWFKRLTSVSSGGHTTAILVDEFISSGETFARLSKLCASIRLPISKAVVLVDFGAEIPASPYPVQCLYRLPLREAV
jgi:hypothetical protein